MTRRPSIRGPWDTGGGPFSGPVPRDILILLGVVFATFSLSFFQGVAVIPYLLSLTREVWASGFLWKLVTYPFVGRGSAGIWILLELLILYWFGKDLFWQLGRRRFWTLILTGALAAAVVAVILDLILALAGAPLAQPFVIMQGQRMVLAILIAAFATLNRNATILLFFVLPLKAGWFLWLEILFAFLAFLGTKDLAGFLGVCTAVGWTWASLSRGGPGRALREFFLRAKQRRMEGELRRLRKKRRFEVIEGEGRKGGDEGGDGDRGGSGPGGWVH